MALEIVQILAAGTFGHVAVVRDTSDDSLLAAKVLRDEHIRNPKIVLRMVDEATLLSRLRHPNIVRVVGIREVQGRPVLLLEWIRGTPLDALLVQMPNGLPAGEAIEMVRDATLALQAAYDTTDPATGQPMRVIHRDIKPSNLLLSIEGQLKVLDFGIAKGNFLGKQSETVSVVLGAHGYLAPERLDGADDTPAGDIYAMGCVLFELLTARKIRLSLHHRAHRERMEREAMRIRPPGTSARLATDLADIVTRMTAYDPADRPSHVTVVDLLGRISKAAGWTADLPRMARKYVVPMLAERSFEAPARHPAFESLRFLEEVTGGTPVGAPPRRSDEQLRSFLTEEGWVQRLDQLRMILASDPSWTAQPFLEQLERISNAPFWKRWRTDTEERDQLLAILEIVRARPGRDVLERIRPLLRHRDAEVVSLARAIAES